MASNTDWKPIEIASVKAEDMAVDWDQSIWDAQAKAQAEALKAAMAGHTSSTSAGLYGGVLGGTGTASLGMHTTPVNIFDMMQRGMLYRFDNMLYIVERGGSVAYFHTETGGWTVSEHTAGVIMEGRALGTVNSLLVKLSRSIDENPR